MILLELFTVDVQMPKPSFIKIKSIMGSKIQYVNEKKKPLLYIKLLWRDNKTTWEESSNISQKTRIYFEDHLWTSIQKKTDLKTEFFMNNFNLLNFTLDNTQKNFNHYLPLIDDINTTDLILNYSKRIMFKDNGKQSSLDISLIYDKIDIVKLMISNYYSQSLYSTLLNRLIKIIKYKSIFKNNYNNVDPTVNLNVQNIKIMKLIVLLLKYISMDVALLGKQSNSINTSFNIVQYNHGYEWVSSNFINNYKRSVNNNRLETYSKYQVLSKKKSNANNYVFVHSSKGNRWVIYKQNEGAIGDDLRKKSQRIIQTVDNFLSL
mmetsp:Transcript_2716/g.3927  ORF Transcript_2716/g.3927 Transcript_2716/m.3927 type:complete len:320 (+) Transcript_2716:470-1429(+)